MFQNHLEYHVFTINTFSSSWSFKTKTPQRTIVEGWWIDKSWNYILFFLRFSNFIHIDFETILKVKFLQNGEIFCFFSVLRTTKLDTSKHVILVNHLFSFKFSVVSKVNVCLDVFFLSWSVFCVCFYLFVGNICLLLKMKKKTSEKVCHLCFQS